MIPQTKHRDRADARRSNGGSAAERTVPALAGQVAAGERGLTGVMLESFLVAGRQDPGAPDTLTYGQSVTDACMDFDTTAEIFDRLAAAVRSRRYFYAERGGLVPRQRADTFSELAERST